MKLNDLLADGQSEAGASFSLCPICRASPETLKDPFTVLGFDADTRVRYSKFHGLFSRALNRSGRHYNMPPAGGELDRVGHKVVDKLGDPGKVGMYLCGPTVYAEAHIGHMVGPVIFEPSSE